MKTTLVIIGVCFLVLTVATGNELEKKQDLDCKNLDADLETCNNNFQNNSKAVCSSACKSALTEYYKDCLNSVGLDAFNEGYGLLCGDALTVGATLFTIISAVLVAVTTVPALI